MRITAIVFVCVMAGCGSAEPGTCDPGDFRTCKTTDNRPGQDLCRDGQWTGCLALTASDGGQQQDARAIQADSSVPRDSTVPIDVVFTPPLDAWGPCDGNIGQACCMPNSTHGNGCMDGLACVGGGTTVRHCAECGERNQPCCNWGGATECDPGMGLACLNGTYCAVPP